MKILTLGKFTNQFSRLLVLSLILCGLGGSLLVSVRGSMMEVPLGGYEGDVSTRTNAGKGTVGVADWALVGRFVSGAEVPKVGSEFQRADVAPKETSLMMNFVGDWEASAICQTASVQMAQYMYWIF